MVCTYVCIRTHAVIEKLVKLDKTVLQNYYYVRRYVHTSLAYRLKMTYVHTYIPCFKESHYLAYTYVCTYICKYVYDYLILTILLEYVHTYTVNREMFKVK